jgi:ABC-type sugar transport system ATPase subunit
MAMVFQDYALYPHLNLYGNIAFALKPTVKSRADLDRRVRTAVPSSCRWPGCPQ